jgi:hypothetical protein
VWRTKPSLGGTHRRSEATQVGSIWKRKLKTFDRKMEITIRLREKDRKNILVKYLKSEKSLTKLQKIIIS